MANLSTLPSTETQTNRHLRLISDSVGDFSTAGAVIELDWQYTFLGGRGGFYSASPLRISVTPAHPDLVDNIKVKLVEPNGRTGALDKEENVTLDRENDKYVGQITWDSTTNNPYQELSVLFENRSNSANFSPSLLKDPISKRFNFLISLHSEGV
ncbi:hypothetical protein [Nostoc sp.]|uniref:hypothetical protein n=1 Tax=Nostoc sp. TaxID=1180 RepID=UPI002FF48FAB